jgi:hypothetical protein
MRADAFVKVMLFLIAVFLGVIALGPCLADPSPARAQAPEAS